MPVTAISTVGVVASPISITSIPQPHSVPVTIEAAIPFAGQADRWRPELRERYAYDLRQCDYQTLVQEAYTPGCMMRRNRYMVDASRILIAAFDGRPGGTARTLEYAARRRLEIIQIPIDSAPVGI